MKFCTVFTVFSKGFELVCALPSTPTLNFLGAAFSLSLYRFDGLGRCMNISGNCSVALLHYSEVDHLYSDAQRTVFSTARGTSADVHIVRVEGRKVGSVGHPSKPRHSHA